MLLTPQQELRQAVDVLLERNVKIKIANDRNGDRRAVFSTSKKYYDVELLVMDRHESPTIRIAYRNNPTRETNNELLLGKLRVLRLFPDRKVSSGQFPTFISENIVEDFVTIVNCIESTPEFEDSTGNTWKTNGGLEAGTWHIVDIIRSAVKRGHTSALGRDMYECLRSKVEVNKYNSDAGLTWGEHVVPIDFMTQELVRMCSQGVGEDVMYDFLMRNHKVVYITPQQASKMDSELKLQTVMTEGWKDGDSPFARLEAAGIILEGVE